MNSNGKILTVVIPTYNMEKYLPACLDSVTADGVPATLEIIVVNDGSTDDSLDIIRKYERKRPDLIKVIDKENGNYGSCVNAGLAAATGKYFRILDADDCFDTAALVEMLDRLRECKTDLVISLIVEDIYCGDRKVDERHYPFATVRKNHVYKTDEFYIHSHVYQSEFRMHGMTYRTDVLRRSGLHMIEGISYTDNIYLFQPFAYIKDFIVYDLYLYHYRIGREGQTMASEKQKKSLRDIAQVVDFQLCELDKTPQDAHLKTNQKALLTESIGLLMNVLRMQKRLDSELYELLYNIIIRMERYGISHREIRKKWYLRLWRMTRSSRVLDVVLRINGITKK